jgi:hypothetical protein
LKLADELGIDKTGVSEKLEASLATQENGITWG